MLVMSINVQNTMLDFGWLMNSLEGKISYLIREKENMFLLKKAKEVLLIKPTTGMNRSGIAVKSIVEKWNLVFSDIYIIIDDVDLPLCY